MGGMIAQVIAQDEPELVRKLILTGTGPAGGKGIKEVVWVAQVDTLRGLLSRQDPKQFLFFTRTANGKREGKAFLARLQERTIDRDTPTTLSSYLVQLKACRRWGTEEPQDLSRIRQRSYSPRVDGRCRWSAATWTGPCGHGEGSWHAVGVSQG